VAAGAIGAGIGASGALGGITKNIVGQAIAGNIINQGVGIITGQQKGFSWAGVAAAAIAAPITSKISESIKGTAFAQASPLNAGIAGAVAGVLNSTVNELTRVAIQGGRVSWASVAIGGISGGIYGYGEGLGQQARVNVPNADKQAKARSMMVADARKYTSSTMSDALTPEEEILYNKSLEDKKTGLSFSDDFEIRKKLAAEMALYNATKPSVSFLDYTIGVGEIFLGGTYNLGVAAGAGSSGIGYALTGDMDGADNAIRESQKAAGYQLRSAGAEAILNSDTAQYAGKGFNWLKNNTGDFYYEQFGPLAGSIGYAAPDFLALVAAPKVVNATTKIGAKSLLYTGTRALGGLSYVYDTLAPTVSNLFSKIDFIGKGVITIIRANNAYEVIAEVPISGVSRAAHRASANRNLANMLSNDTQFSSIINKVLGQDVLSYMRSGKNLLNPQGTVWHHPANNPNVMQLLRRSEHINPDLQPILHPDGIGGFGTFYGN
jgi:hypothetical protein